MCHKYYVLYCIGILSSCNDDLSNSDLSKKKINKFESYNKRAAYHTRIKTVHNVLKNRVSQLVFSVEVWEENW